MNRLIEKVVNSGMCESHFALSNSFDENFKLPKNLFGEIFKSPKTHYELFLLTKGFCASKIRKFLAQEEINSLESKSFSLDTASRKNIKIDAYLFGHKDGLLVLGFCKDAIDFEFLKLDPNPELHVKSPFSLPKIIKREKPIKGIKNSEFQLEQNLGIC